VPGLDMLSLWKTDPLAFSLSSCNNNDTGLILILVLCLFIYNINFDLVLKCFPAS